METKLADPIAQLPGLVANEAYRRMAICYAPDRLERIEGIWARIFARQPDKVKRDVAGMVDFILENINADDPKIRDSAFEHGMNLLNICEREAATVH